MLTFASTAVLILSCGLVSIASAGTYRAEICTPTAYDQGFLFPEAPPPETKGFHEVFECGHAPGTLRMFANAKEVSGAVLWKLKAPPNLTIKELDADRVLGPRPWDPLFHWFLRGPGKTLDSAQVEPAPDGHVHYVVETTEIESELECIRTDCGFREGFLLNEVALSNIVATVEDRTAPTISVGAPPAATPLSGTVEIPYKAQDTGSGVDSLLLSLDYSPQIGGIQVSEDHDENEGRCREPFTTMRPCRLLVERSFSVDTTQIPDGTHTLTPIFADAAANLVVGQPFTITVHNRPTAKARPAFFGTATAGVKLSVSEGEWEGAPTTFDYQWLRCPASIADGSEAGCEPIGDATADYLAGATDVGKRLVAKVTASNGAGSESALSAPSNVVAAFGEPKGPKPPQTEIARHPHDKSALHTVKFTFSSDQPGAGFQCRLDRAPFKPCRSPFKHKVSRGRHSFQVRALSPAGLADPTPATFRWRAL